MLVLASSAAVSRVPSPVSLSLVANLSLTVSATDYPAFLTPSLRSGDILVCDSSDRVAVFPTLSSSAASPSSPVWIGGPGVLKSPAALAVSGGALYILDEDSARVQVFN